MLTRPNSASLTKSTLMGQIIIFLFQMGIDIVFKHKYDPRSVKSRFTQNQPVEYKMIRIYIMDMGRVNAQRLV